MIKECVLCGIRIEAIANTRYCRACAGKMKKMQNNNRNKDYHIPGQSDRLSKDVHQAIVLGLSYGVYIARIRPKEENKNAYKRKRIF